MVAAQDTIEIGPESQKLAATHAAMTVAQMDARTWTLWMRPDRMLTCELLYIYK